MEKHLIALVLLLSSTVNQAEVPNKFTAGTPAKASEVNENFDYLEGEASSIKVDLNNLASSSSAIEERVGDLENPSSQSNTHSISYSYKPSSVGESIELLNGTYKVVKIPMLEFGTGDKYSIKHLVKILNYDSGGGNGGDPSYIIPTVRRVSHDVSPCETGEYISISGFDAKIQTHEHRDTYYTSTTYYDEYSELSISTQYNANICIQIGETKLSISRRLTKGEQHKRDGLAMDDFDMTDDTNWNALRHDETYLQALDDLIDYIKIERIE